MIHQMEASWSEGRSHGARCTCGYIVGGHTGGGTRQLLMDHCEQENASEELPPGNSESAGGGIPRMDPAVQSDPPPTIAEAIAGVVRADARYRQATKWFIDGDNGLSEDDLYNEYLRFQQAKADAEAVFWHRMERR